MAYTRKQIIERLEKISADMSLFYKSGCVNYRGRTSDTKEYYTEVIAEWLLDHLPLFEQIREITRLSPYDVDGHDGVPDNPNSNREEELIAMAMKHQGAVELVGEIIDYQTPLKNCRKDKAGKIDLLAYDGKMLRILELKKPDSKETMLRCVLEGYTYLRTANKEKLVSDFDLPPDTAVRACPFVFQGGSQWKEMQQNRPHLKQLMAVLGCKPYYIAKENNLYIITEE